jgi:hypothetical protein
MFARLAAALALAASAWMITPCFAQSADFDNAQTDEEREQVCRVAHDMAGEAARMRDSGIPLAQLNSEWRAMFDEKDMGPQTRRRILRINKGAYIDQDLTQQEYADKIQDECASWFEE